MIQAITLGQLHVSPVEHFKTGHFYMVVAHTQAYVDYNFVTDSENFKKIMEKRGGDFKIVYESPAFLNSVHYHEKTPYLKMYILEKL